MKREIIRFRTEKGIAKYPKLDQPYSWSNADNRSVPDADGQYELIVQFTPDDAEPIKAAVKQAIKAAGVEPKNLPFKKNEETGMVEVKFKAYGTRRDGTPNRVTQVDGALNPLPASFKLTGGSEVKVSGYVSVAKLGVRLTMNAVQVIKYVPFVEKTDFAPAEDGFVYKADGGATDFEPAATSDDEGDYGF